LKTVKLIVAYPQPNDASAFEKIYQQEHIPMAVAKLQGKTKIAATKILQSPPRQPQFYRVAEVYFPSMEALQQCAESAGGKETYVHVLSNGACRSYCVSNMKSGPSVCEPQHACAQSSQNSGRSIAV
jgi:uncharacterized protein (TIGR02118 family)